jgi:YHS domain-containing protein
MISEMKIILVAVIAIFGMNGISFAMSCDMASHKDSGQAYGQEVEKGSKATDISNKVCPVGGETIKESEKATYEYNGKIYNFCCPGCIPEFKKNPEKYIAKMEQSANSEQSMQEGHQHEH